jgi:hypothetical protein
MPARLLKSQGAAFWVFEHDTAGNTEPVPIKIGSTVGNKKVARRHRPGCSLTMLFGQANPATVRP